MQSLDTITLDLFGERVAVQRRLHGGDLSAVMHLRLQSGGEMVVKMGPLVEREGRMLTVLSNAGAPTPKVLGTRPGFLFLEVLEDTGPSAASWSRLGEALATLHDFPNDAEDTPYGWTESYAFEDVIIPAAGGRDWPDYWAATRILPQVKHLPGLGTRLTKACERLPKLLPAATRPSLTHGDLWTGNVIFGPANQVHLIDPACAYGDREVDLAMLTLFGSPGPGFDDAYGPLEPDWEIRRAVYQLWPALVHLRLFGTSYRGLVERLLTAIGA